MTVIIAGKVYVAPEHRERFIEGYRVLMQRARAYPGCLDVSISPDPLETGRVNLFEHWESHDVLDRWRAIAPRPAGKVKVKADEVRKHYVSETRLPFG